MVSTIFRSCDSLTAKMLLCTLTVSPTRAPVHFVFDLFVESFVCNKFHVVVFGQLEPIESQLNWLWRDLSNSDKYNLRGNLS